MQFSSVFYEKNYLQAQISIGAEVGPLFWRLGGLVNEVRTLLQWDLEDRGGGLYSQTPYLSTYAEIG